MSDFLQMGGYAAYVWPAFGLTALVLLANVVIARAGLSAERRAVRRRLRVEEERP